MKVACVLRRYWEDKNSKNYHTIEWWDNEEDLAEKGNIIKYKLDIVAITGKQESETETEILHTSGMFDPMQSGRKHISFLNLTYAFDFQWKQIICLTLEQDI